MLTHLDRKSAPLGKNHFRWETDLGSLWFAGPESVQILVSAFLPVPPFRFVPKVIPLPLDEEQTICTTSKPRTTICGGDGGAYSNQY
jgi:hypothetical protein